MGHGKLIDSMIHDGLWDPYGDKHMGSCAESLRPKYEFTPRGAGRLHAARATAAPARPPRRGKFAEEIVPRRDRGEEGRPTTVDRDEEPFRADLDKMRDA